MDGISGLASVLAVADTVYKLSKLLKSIRDAPAELRTLAQDLDRFRGILTEVRSIAEKQSTQQHTPTPSIVFLATLHDCEERFKSIDQCASKLTRSLQTSGFRKTWASLKIPLRKGELQKLRLDLRQSTRDLSLSLQVITWANQ